MKILVNGASGLVGSALVRALSAEGHCGYAVSRRQIVGLPPGWASVRRQELLAAGSGFAGKCDCVVHLEVKQHVLYPTNADCADFVKVNVDGLQDWLNWCEQNKVERLIYFSSINAVCVANSGATDETARGPNASLYSRSKWLAEGRVRSWVGSSACRHAVILRSAVIYGPGCVGNIGAMVAATLSGRFFLIGCNCNVKSIVGMRNVTAAVVHLIKVMGHGRCEIYNLVDRESYSVRQIDAMIRRCIGKSGNSPAIPLTVARLVARVGDFVFRVAGVKLPLNSLRLASLTEPTEFSSRKLMDSGFVHPQTTEQGIAEMVEWYRGV